MLVRLIEVQIRLYVKDLRILTFDDYNELLGRMKLNNNVEDILLELMKTESLQH